MPRRAKRPKTQAELTAWIKRLAAEDNMREFYLSGGWRRLSRHVRYQLDNNECQICKQRGKYTQAHSVHHVNGVKERPDLAMSVWYYDADGTCKRNLISICEPCHNEVHGKYMHGIRREKYTNEERW